MSYQSLQTALKDYRAKGIEVNCKLNAKKEILQSEYDRLNTETTVATVEAATVEVATVEVATVEPATVKTATVKSEPTIIGLMIFVLPIVLAVLTIEQSIKVSKRHQLVRKLKVHLKQLSCFIRDIPDLTLTQLIGI